MVRCQSWIYWDNRNSQVLYFNICDIRDTLVLNTQVYLFYCEVRG
nr:MAG TPA_asm: hypothetical protein [Caudoviricetes sp.]